MSEGTKYTIAVDFDGVLHSYTSPWVDAATIPDPPVPGAIEWLNEMAEHFRIVVFTTRGATEAGRDAVRYWLWQSGFTRADDVGEDEVLITDRKPGALVYVDDRAYRFDGSNFPTRDQIHRELRPWNKKGSS